MPVLSPPRSRSTGTALAVLASASLGLGSPAAADTGAADVAKLNAQRTLHGIPAGIVHVPEWTSWCELHIFYMQANGGELTHHEQPGRPGFTVAGQRAGANSVLWKGESWNATNPWETAPIHLHQLLAPRLDAIGIADRDRYVCATTLLSRNRPPPPANVVYTYPGNGTLHRFRETASEDPYAPGERVGIPRGRRTGPYLYVSPDGPALSPLSQARITAAALTGPTGPVSLRVVDNFTNGITGFIPTGGQLIPDRPLKPATAYTATVAMSVLPAAGAAPIPFAHRWSFTTVSRRPRRPGLRLVGRSRNGRLVGVSLRTRRAARGQATLRIRRCVRARGRIRCNRRHRLRVNRTRRGAVHRLSVRLSRRGRWSLRPVFNGSRGWGNQRLAAFRVRVR